MKQQLYLVVVLLSGIWTQTMTLTGTIWFAHGLHMPKIVEYFQQIEILSWKNMSRFLEIIAS